MSTAAIVSVDWEARDIFKVPFAAENAYSRSMFFGRTHRWWGSLFSVAWLVATLTAGGEVILSEMVPVNRGGLKDSDGESPDWVELFNNGSAPVQLGGYSLSDDASKPDQWKLPDIAIAPGSFLIVFASGKNRQSDNAGELHANFKLSASGDYVGLFDPAGKLVSSLGPEMPPLENGQSFGLPFSNGKPASGGRPVLLAEATPGAPNADAVDTIALRVPVFSQQHGFFTKPFRLALKAAKGAKIRYTLDGTTPTESTGQLYRGAIPIPATTVVRAIAFGVPGKQSSATHTQSFLFPDAVARQANKAPAGWPSRLSSRRGGSTSYGMHDPKTIGTTHEKLVEALLDLPSLSLVTDSANFWGRDGIWSRSQNRGSDWERPLSVELLDPSGEEKGFQINCGVRIRGGASRSEANPKHAMRLYFRKQYGEGKLRYPLFGDEGAKAFEDIDLRTAQNYSWSYEQSTENSFVREVFARDTQRDMGRTYTRSRYYHLYINGLYWGIYQTQEHAEAAYGSTYFGGEESDFDTVKSSGHSIEATDGDLDGWEKMWSLARRLAASRDAMEREALYQQLRGCDPDGIRNEALPVYVDEANLIDYMLIVFYTGMWDGPITRYANNSTCRNWFGLWKRTGEFGFQYFCHDFEHAMGVADSLEVDRTGPFSAGENIETSNPQWIHQQLMASESYLAAFQARSAEAFAPGGLLSPEICRARLNRRVSQIDRAIIAESARWGGARPLTRTIWRNEIQNIYDFFEQRHEIAIDQLRSARRFADGSTRSRIVPAPLYPGPATQAITAPEITLRPDGIYFLNDNPDATIIYTVDGTDPRGDNGHPIAGAKQATAEKIAYTTLLSKAPLRAIVPGDASLGNRWIDPSFDDSRWMQGRGAAGYETKARGSTGTLYHDYIGLNLQAVAAQINTTAYLRYTFPVSGGTAYQRMVLRMRYDDGFVAYLNGKEICRANAPEVLTWNAQSGGKHDDDAALEFVDFDVSSHVRLLRDGNNVLAIHALNDYLASSDMLMEPQLAAGVVESGTAIPIDESAALPNIVARANMSSQWSRMVRLANGSNGTPASTANLTLSEIHYHPTEPTEAEKTAGHTDADAFEFIELANTSDETINLAVTQITGGISVVILPGSAALLPPNGRCVLVNDRAAFIARYGTSATIAGEFEGKLANSGDTLQLVDAGGSILHSIRYDDKSPWPKEADGDGPSLELRSPGSRANLSLPGSWKASATAGGSPGMP